MKKPPRMSTRRADRKSQQHTTEKKTDTDAQEASTVRTVRTTEESRQFEQTSGKTTRWINDDTTSSRRTRRRTDEEL